MHLLSGKQRSLRTQALRFETSLVDFLELEVNVEEKALRSKSFMALRVLNVEELLETGLQLTCAVSICGLLWWRSGVALPQQRRILQIGSTRQVSILAKLKISQIRKAMLRTTISLQAMRKM